MRLKINIWIKFKLKMKQIAINTIYLRPMKLNFNIQHCKLKQKIKVYNFYYFLLINYMDKLLINFYLFVRNINLNNLIHSNLN